MPDQIPPSFDLERLGLARYTVSIAAMLEQVFELHCKRYALVVALRRIIDSRN